MTLYKLFQLLSQSMRRNRRDFLLSSIGIIVGISTLFFFTALGYGIRDVVLEKIFIVNQLEVVQKTYDLGGFRTGGLFGQKKLDDSVVRRLQELPGVASVYPKMQFTFPTRAQGGKRFLGSDMWAELIADGIPPELVAEDVEDDFYFRDWEAPIACSDSSSCPDGYQCGNDDVCEPLACRTHHAKADSPCTGVSYCHATLGVCTLPIPVIISPLLLEMYNTSLHTAFSGSQSALAKLPRLSESALVGLEIEAHFGESFLGRAAQGDSIKHRLRLVGFSDKAIRIGVTMPIGYVKRLNERFSGAQAGEEYHAIIVETMTNEAVASVAHAVTEEMGLSLSERYASAQRAGLLIMILTLVFNLIALIILVISAINIMHTFLMIIMERRHEIGLMRALGATTSNVRMLVLAEATILGLFGGVIGALTGYVTTLAIDFSMHRFVPDFPFKPESLFLIHEWYWPAAIFVAIFFCTIGAILPALRASRVDPARTLTG